MQYIYDDGASGGMAAYGRLDEVIYPNGRTLAYGYGPAGGMDDVLSRIATIAAERGYLQSAEPVSLTARAFEQEWGLDGTGNWAAFNEDLDGTGWDLEQTRQHNAANELTGATDWAAPAHDLAGNMTALPKRATKRTAKGPRKSKRRK